MFDRGSDRWLAALGLVTAVSMCVALWMVFRYAPEEKVMGAVQRIFYFHVPAAFVTFLSVFVLLGGSVAYLWKRDLRWDNLSLAATEIGLLFCTLVLITGPIWAKPAWGVWWTWEARLTTTLILWILLAACLTVRRYAESRELGGRLAAVLGIFAAVDVPIIHKAVVWWRGQHPNVFKPGREEAMPPEMLQTFLFCLLVFALLYGLLLALRYRVADLADRTDRLLRRAARQAEAPAAAFGGKRS